MTRRRRPRKQHEHGQTRTVDAASVERGIADRLEDADLLWAAGRRESALLLVLVAVAARGKLQHPDITCDGENFEHFLGLSHAWTISVEFRGRLISIDQLLYKHLRCMLVHEAHAPVDIRVDEELGDPEGNAVRAGGAPDHLVLLSLGWFPFLKGVATDRR